MSFGTTSGIIAAGALVAITGCASIAGLDFTGEPPIGAGGAGGSGGATAASGGVGGTGTGTGVGGGSRAEVTDYFELVFQDDPYAYWRLGDEPKSGTNAVQDAMGNAHGDYEGTPGSAMGLVGDTDGAMEVVNVNDDYAVINLGSLASTLDTGFAVEAWFQVSNMAPDDQKLTILAKEDTFELSVVRTTQGEVVTFAVKAPNMAWVSLASQVVPSGERHYACGQHTGMQAPALWVDGGPEVVARQTVDYNVGTDWFYIGVGVESSALTVGFLGVIDEVALHDLTFDFGKAQAHWLEGQP